MRSGVPPTSALVVRCMGLGLTVSLSLFDWLTSAMRTASSSGVLALGIAAVRVTLFACDRRWCMAVMHRRSSKSTPVEPEEASSIEHVVEVSHVFVQLT